MTDTPGWTSPGSPEPPREAEREAAPAPTPGPSDQASLPPVPGPYGPGYGTQPGAPAPQGWGQPQPGGPQYGWAPPQGWGAPASPKPGVIPLRPLGVGELLDGAFTTVRKHWRTTIGLSLGLSAVVQVLSAVLDWWAYQQNDRSADLIAQLVPIPFSMLVGVLAVGLMTMVVSRAVLGQAAGLGDAWRAARPQLLPLLGLTLLTSLILAAAAMVMVVPLIAILVLGEDSPALLLLLPPGIALMLWLAIRLSLAAPALMLEKQGVIAAVRRSWRLVRGSWWRIFGITLLVRLVVILIALFAVVPFTFAAMMAGGAVAGEAAESDGGALAGIILIAVGTTLVEAITIPITAAATVLLYVDQRIRREALDIELARAAGLPDHGTGWGGPAAPGGPGAPGAPGVTLPGQTTPPGA